MKPLNLNSCQVVLRLNGFQYMMQLKTLSFHPTHKTTNPIHVRDSIDIQRIMVIVWLAAFPAMFFGMYNIGNQTLDYLTLAGSSNTNDWHHVFINFIGYSNDSFITKMWVGAVYFVPIYAVTFAVGILWEILFAVVRKHEINEGLFVSSILFALSCPPDLPLWQAAMGITFGIVIGKEVFGGTGKNFSKPSANW
jgi:Na+-transporting NADH:ubiquinone oxidoreductase subunit B